MAWRLPRNPDPVPRFFHRVGQELVENKDGRRLIPLPTSRNRTVSLLNLREEWR